MAAARSGIGPGQLDYEWCQLLKKLSVRDPDRFRRWSGIERPEAHPLFVVVPGAIRSWEKTTDPA